MMSQERLTAAMAAEFQAEADEAEARGDAALARVLSRRASEWRELAAEQEAARQVADEREAVGDVVRFRPDEGGGL